MSNEALIISDDLDYSGSVTQNELKFYIGGDFRGMLIESGHVERSFARAMEMVNYCVEDLMLQSIGKFYVKKQSEREVAYFSSVSDYGLYFMEAEGVVTMKRRSEDFNAPIDYDKAIHSAKVHHLVGRSHYGQELFTGVKRVLPGSTLQINNGDITFLTYLVKRHKNNAEFLGMSKLNTCVSSVLSSYRLNESDCLLFSGGIDSAVLASIIVSNNEKCDLINFRYDNALSDDTKIVESFKERYLKSLKFMGLELMSYEDIVAMMKKGFGTIQGPQYLKDRRIGKRKLITGQNLDTLMHIDTYAPGSAYQGLVGLLMNSLFFRKRFLLSHYFFNSRLAKRITFLSVTNLNGREFDIIDKMYSLGDEHTEITSDIVRDLCKNRPDPYISSFLKNSWSQYRESEHYDYSFLFKVSRFYKTCHNVNANYDLLMEDSGYNERLTPYTEGPVAHYLLSTRLPLLQLFLPKRVMYRIFQKNSGHSYKSFVNVASKASLIPYLKQRMSNQNRQKEIVDGQNKVDKIIINLIRDLPFHLEEFKPIYSRFLDRKTPLSKREYLELCRSINMNYFYLNYGSNTY